MNTGDLKLWIDTQMIFWSTKATKTLKKIRQLIYLTTWTIAQ